MRTLRITIRAVPARAAPAGIRSHMKKPPMSLALSWTDGLAFRVDAPEARTLVTDGDGEGGLSPVELLAAATAACMGVDLVHIVG